MIKFIQKFYARMLIMAGAFAFLATLLLQMSFDRIEIRHDSSVLPAIIIVPIIWGAAIALFTVKMAVHNTNVLRRYEYSLGSGGERVFYLVFALLMIAIAAADILFLLNKLLPMLDSALAYAIKDAHIKNETPEMRDEIIAQLRRRYDAYKTGSRAAGAATLFVQAVIYGMSAGRLVSEYRDPPDYWSGKKGKVKRK